MLKLPEQAYIVEVDKPEEKTAGGIILAPSEILEPDTGKIIWTGSGVKEFQNCRIRFRNSHAEDLEIDGMKYKFFRDFDSSFYYVLIE